MKKMPIPFERIRRTTCSIFPAEFGGLVEEEVRLVEEKDQIGLIGIADFRHRLEKLGEKPE